MTRDVAAQEQGAQMAEQAGQFIPKEELERRLLRLAQSHPQALPLFAARCALRVFPVLALSGDFGFWPEQQRASYLLRIWQALLFTWEGQTLPADVIDALRKITEQTQGFLAGSDQSTLQGEVLKWSRLVATAEQAARIGNVTSSTEQAGLASVVAETSHYFLFHVAQQSALGITLQDLEFFASSSSEKSRNMPLWLGMKISPRLSKLAFEQLPRGVQQLSRMEQSRGSSVAGLLDRFLATYRTMCAQEGSVSNVSEDLSALTQYFQSRSSPSGSATVSPVAPVSPPQPAPARPSERPSVQPGSSSPVSVQPGPEEIAANLNEPWDETQEVKPITDLDLLAAKAKLAANVATPSPDDETIFQEFRVKKPEAESVTQTQAEADATLQRELSFRPSDRHSIEQISEVDNLNRGKLVNALATVLTAPDNYGHQTIGLLGDWGVGKSTLLNLLKIELMSRQEQQPFLFAEFNAWAYEHTDNLQAGIAQEMLKALSSDLLRLKPARNEPANFLGKIEQKVKDVWNDVRARTVWMCKRFLITCEFAIALKPARVLWLLVMLLVAVSPFAIGDADEVLAALFFSSDPNNVSSTSSITGKGVAAIVGTSLWVVGFFYYFAVRLKDVLANPLAKELLTYLKLPDYGEHLGAIPVMRKNIKILCDVRLRARSKKHVTIQHIPSKNISNTY